MYFNSIFIQRVKKQVDILYFDEASFLIFPPAFPFSPYLNDLQWKTDVKLM